MRKANLAGEYTVYAMAEVALAAIDLVTLNMDFDTGADHDQIVARLLPRVAAQAPQRPVAEHERVARWVLENLINVGSVDRGFRAVYGTFAPDGVYVRRDYDFKLIEEVPGHGGSVYLRTTDEAVNVLVGALDTDVTSAQIAAEVKLEVLISRGRLADAQLAAEQARYRTVQYAETLRRALDATRRNVRAVDWLNAVPDMIAEALDHVADRYRHENAILTNIRKARDEAEDPEHKRRAAELVDIVKDCIRRHTQLQSRLLEAGPAVPRRAGPAGLRHPHRTAPGLDLYGQLVAPAAAAARWSRRSGSPTRSSPAAPGCARPSSVRVGDLVDILLTPPVEREHLGAEMPEPDLIATPDDSRFSEEQLAAAMELLDLPADAPRRLSGLLAEARPQRPRTALPGRPAGRPRGEPAGRHRLPPGRGAAAVRRGRRHRAGRPGVRRGRPDRGHGPAGRGGHGRGPHGGRVSVPGPTAATPPPPDAAAPVPQEPPTAERAPHAESRPSDVQP